MESDLFFPITGRDPIWGNKNCLDFGDDYTVVPLSKLKELHILNECTLLYVNYIWIVTFKMQALKSMSMIKIFSWVNVCLHMHTYAAKVLEGQTPKG